MKSDERHELKSNELRKLTARVRPVVEQYGLHIVLAISAVIVVAAAVMFWNRATSAEKAAGWTDLVSANSAEKMLEVAEDEALSKKQVAAWARLQAAEQYLDSGIRQSLQNREGERGLVSDLDEARKNFELVLEVAPPGSGMKERALYGLGNCLETMAGVNQRTDTKGRTTAELLDGAAKAYETLLKEYPNSPYNQKRYEEEELGKLERHLQYLKSEQAREFYAWFRTQNPKPEDRRSPFDDLPFDHPPFDSGPLTLPPIPDRLRLPDEDAESGPALPGLPDEPAEREADDAAPETDPANDEGGKTGGDEGQAAPDSPPTSDE